MRHDTTDEAGRRGVSSPGAAGSAAPGTYDYPASHQYSRSDYDRVARLYLDGMDALHVAARVGMSETTARKFLHRNGLVRRHPEKRRGPWAARQRRRSRALEMRAEGKTPRQIARALRVHVETVRIYLRAE